MVLKASVSLRLKAGERGTGLRGGFWVFTNPTYLRRALLGTLCGVFPLNFHLFLVFVSVVIDNFMSDYCIRAQFLMILRLIFQ